MMTSSSLPTEGTDLIMDWTTGTNQVLFTADDGEPTGCLLTAARLSSPKPTSPTLAAIVALASNDYAEQTGVASVIQDNHVNVFTSSTGWASRGRGSLLLTLPLTTWLTTPPSSWCSTTQPLPRLSWRMFLMQVMRLKAGQMPSVTLLFSSTMLLQLVLQPHSITATSVFCLLLIAN